MVVTTLPLVATVGGVRAPPAMQPQMMQFGSVSSSPPLSPTHSEQSLAGMSPDDHIFNGDAFGEMVRSVLLELLEFQSNLQLPYRLCSYTQSP